MKILRKYQCLDCGHRYRKTFEVSDDAYAALVDPPCPACLHQAAATPARIAAPRIATTKAKALDAAWDIAQQDYGFTDMNDSGKVGDAAYKPPPVPPPSQQAPQDPRRPGFLWGGANPTAPMPVEQIRAGGQLGAAIANAEGRNPMRMLHQTRPRLVPIPVNKGS